MQHHFYLDRLLARKLRESGSGKGGTQDPDDDFASDLPVEEVSIEAFAANYR